MYASSSVIVRNTLYSALYFLICSKYESTNSKIIDIASSECVQKIIAFFQKQIGELKKVSEENKSYLQKCISKALVEANEIDGDGEIAEQNLLTAFDCENVEEYLGRHFSSDLKLFSEE